jgi:hypothetical protein
MLNTAPGTPKGVNRAGNWKSLAHASGSQITQSPRNQQGITHRSSDLLPPASALSNGFRAMIALSIRSARAPAERSSPYETMGPLVTPCSSATIIPNVVQRGDALTLLRALPDSCTKLVFFNPEYRGVLDHLQYGNEGSRQRGRAGLPAMASDLY